MSNMTTFVFKNETVDLLTVEIISERLCLIPILLVHEKDIFREFTSEITTYMFPKPAEDISETRAFIQESINDMKAGHNLQLVILKKETNEFLGCCGLHGFENPEIPEFGIWLKKDAQGFGYGKEAIHALYGWANHHLNVDYYIYPVDCNNIASRKIPESLSGIIIKEYIDQGLAGNKLDNVVYKIPYQSLKHT
jgi:[ribosomal protein S5]-alanine N-acetyltransferase